MYSFCLGNTCVTVLCVDSKNSSVELLRSNFVVFSFSEQCFALSPIDLGGFKYFMVILFVWGTRILRVLLSVVQKRWVCFLGLASSLWRLYFSWSEDSFSDKTKA